MTWRASSQAKYDCKYHLIWWPKRRWGLADAEVRTAVAEVFRAIAEGFGFLIEELPVEDHVHLLVEFPPRYAIALVVGILKSLSASRAFRHFPGLRARYWSGERGPHDGGSRDRRPHPPLHPATRSRTGNQSAGDSFERRLTKPRPSGGEGH